MKVFFHEKLANFHPWQVALYQRSYNGGYRFFCGGSIIDSTTILTAAHCVRHNSGTTSPSKLRVKIAAHDLRSSGRMVNVVRVTPHEKYRPWTTSDDIALLKLDKPIQFSTWVRPVCLPSRILARTILDGKTVTVSGWGTTRSQGGLPNKLNEVDVRVFTNTECRRNYEQLRGDFFGNVPRGQNSFLCAGSRAGGKDSCQVSNIVGYY